MVNVKGEEISHQNGQLLSFLNNKHNYSGHFYNYKVIIICLLGLFILACDGAAVPQPRISPFYVKDKVTVIDIIRDDPTNEHEPPVTSSDLPKQIPAPPRPHFASTPHYEQQLARIVWVTPQYNTPYPVVNQV